MNPIRGETALKLGDGREFTLVLDFEALVQAEAAYGKPLAVLMSEATTGFVGATRALLFGALRAKHPGLTLRDASGMLQSDSDTISEALTRAAEAAFPAEDKEAGNAPKPHAGKASGRNGAKRT